MTTTKSKIHACSVVYSLLYAIKNIFLRFKQIECVCACLIWFIIGFNLFLLLHRSNVYFSAFREFLVDLMEAPGTLIPADILSAKETTFKPYNPKINKIPSLHSSNDIGVAYLRPKPLLVKVAVKILRWRVARPWIEGRVLKRQNQCLHSKVQVVSFRDR